VVWDLGSIAMNGGPIARAFFRDVLVASASVPGMFPPVIIRVQDSGGDYSEAHVDRTATVPFFVPPALLQLPQDVPHRSPPTVYVIVDGRLCEKPMSTRLRFRTIVSRSISAGMTHMVRTTLELTASTAQRQGANLQYSAIPTAYPNLDAFDFRATAMRPLFQYGYECSRVRNIPCPAEDEFIGRIAAR